MKIQRTTRKSCSVDARALIWCKC